mmetsp:Transcript_96725/g.215570  ORF Transcript_96725/g.215570 Transcript_96725/m.215570 type:complete len:256 (-) Transcript_96725:14-781(-)
MRLALPSGRLPLPSRALFALNHQCRPIPGHGVAPCGLISEGLHVHHHLRHLVVGLGKTVPGAGTGLLPGHWRWRPRPGAARDRGLGCLQGPGLRPWRRWHRQSAAGLADLVTPTDVLDRPRFLLRLPRKHRMLPPSAVLGCLSKAPFLALSSLPPPPLLQLLPLTRLLAAALKASELCLVLLHEDGPLKGALLPTPEAALPSRVLGAPGPWLFQGTHSALRGPTLRGLGPGRANGCGHAKEPAGGAAQLGRLEPG